MGGLIDVRIDWWMDGWMDWLIDYPGRSNAWEALAEEVAAADLVALVEDALDM